MEGPRRGSRERRQTPRARERVLARSNRVCSHRVFYHGTFGSSGGACTHLFISVPAPRGHPSGAGSALHSPSPATLGLRRARGEKVKSAQARLGRK